jgi:Zn ribbon nucleic-acid-binding protein
VRAPLAPAWLDYRNRLAALVAAIVGLVLWAGGLDAPLRAGLGAAGTNAIAAAWVTGSIAVLGWFAAFRCPFCGRCFHWTLWVANPVARRCLHCGFERWRDPDAARALRGR